MLCVTAIIVSLLALTRGEAHSFAQREKQRQRYGYILRGWVVGGGARVLHLLIDYIIG